MLTYLEQLAGRVAHKRIEWRLCELAVAQFDQKSVADDVGLNAACNDAM